MTMKFFEKNKRKIKKKRFKFSGFTAAQCRRRDLYYYMLLKNSKTIIIIYKI